MHAVGDDLQVSRGRPGPTAVANGVTGGAVGLTGARGSGWSRTWRAATTGKRSSRRRRLATAARERPLVDTIYYLLTAASPIGHLHRNRSSITHLHHRGGPATYLLVAPGGRAQEVVLGADPEAGQLESFTAHGGWWKASDVLSPGATDSLISEVVAPGLIGRRRSPRRPPLRQLTDHRGQADGRYSVMGRGVRRSGGHGRSGSSAATSARQASCKSPDDVSRWRCG